MEAKTISERPSSRSVSISLRVMGLSPYVQSMLVMVPWSEVGNDTVQERVTALPSSGACPALEVTETFELGAAEIQYISDVQMMSKP